MSVHKQCFKQSEDSFIKWIVGSLGHVILGAKPAEIMSFPLKDTSTKEKIKKIEEAFSICNHISYEISYYKNSSIKVIFYNIKVLDQSLKDNRNLRFLKSIGYPSEYSLDSYLKQLIKKIDMGIIPDEIGIFLGYPLKDVIGFIGHPSLKLTKINGWRVYGDSRISDMKHNEFIKAKEKIRQLLFVNSFKNILNKNLLVNY